MTCPSCSKEVDSYRTIVRHGKLVSGCWDCLDIVPLKGQNDISKYNRDREREDYRQDIVQPFEGRDYLHARGIDKAREMGYSDEDIRKHY